MIAKVSCRVLFHGMMELTLFNALCVTIMLFSSVIYF